MREGSTKIPQSVADLHLASPDDPIFKQPLTICFFGGPFAARRPEDNQPRDSDTESPTSCDEVTAETGALPTGTTEDEAVTVQPVPQPDTIVDAPTEPEAKEPLPPSPYLDGKPWYKLFTRAQVLEDNFYYLRRSRGRWPLPKAGVALAEYCIHAGFPSSCHKIRGWCDDFFAVGANFAFLDGGYLIRSSNYALDFRCTYIVGHKAFHFLCAEVGIKPPRLTPEEAEIYNHNRLREEAQRVDEGALEYLENLRWNHNRFEDGRATTSFF